MAIFRQILISDGGENVCYRTDVQNTQTSSVKCEGTSVQKRSLSLSPPKKAAASECSFDAMSQRANAETTVMRRILSFPLHGHKN
jgi:hypothetical protein